MTEFEKNARQQLDNYGSPVDTERLWKKVEQDLQSDKRRPKLLWLWLFGFGLFVAGGAIWYMEQAANRPSPDPKQAFPLLSSPSVASSKTGQKKHTTTTTGVPAKAAPPTLSARMEATRSKTNMVGSGRLSASFQSSLSQSTESQALPAVPSSASNAVDRQPQTRLTQPLEKMDAFAQLPTVAQLLNITPRPLDHQLEFSKTDCPSWRKNRGLHPYFGLYGGAQYPLKSLTSKTAEFEDLAQRRTETETVLEGVAVGGYLGLKHWSGFLAEGGLEYNRINERFDLKSVATDTIGRIGITGIIVNAPGDTTFIQDSIFVVEETRSVKKTFNHYQFLQIPVAIGYEWSNKDRWTMYVKAGVAFNIRFRQKAEIINLAGAPEKYVSGNTRPDYPFRSNIGLTPFVNLGARYRLLNGLSVFGEVRYLHQASDITTVAYPLRQRYSLPGVNLGVHVQF